MKFFYLPNKENRTEEPQNKSFNEGTKNMLDTTLEILQLIDIKERKLSREELEKLCEKLIDLNIKQGDQLEDDISLIGDLEGHCFKWTSHKEEITNMRSCIDTLKNTDYELRKEKEKMKEDAKE